MAGIILPGQFTSQPQYPALVSNAGLGRGVVFATYGGGPDVVTGTLPIFYGGASKSVGAKGNTTRTTSTSADGIYWPLPSSSALYRVTNQFTFLSFCTITTGANFNTLISIPEFNSGSWTAPWIAAGLLSGSGGTQLNVHFSNGTGSTQYSNCGIASFLLQDGIAHCYAASKSADGFVQGARDGSLFGASTSLTQAAAGDRTAAVSWNVNRPVQMMNRSYQTAAEGYIGGAFGGVIWNRQLTNRELMDATANPWQIFQAPGRIFPISDAAAASGYKPYWSSQRPRVYGAGVR